MKKQDDYFFHCVVHFGLGLFAAVLCLADSPFTAEKQFHTSTVIINPAHHSNGGFEFNLTNRTTPSFGFLFSTNVTLPLTNRTNLGPPHP